MREGEVEKQLKLLQQEIALTGHELDGLKREQRATMNALRLEVEALRRCLERLHPDSRECLAALRAEVIQETDPEGL